jgi:hypothetical protein
MTYLIYLLQTDRHVVVAYSSLLSVSLCSSDLASGWSAEEVRHRREWGKESLVLFSTIWQGYRHFAPLPIPWCQMYVHFAPLPFCPTTSHPVGPDVHPFCSTFTFMPTKLMRLPSSLFHGVNGRPFCGAKWTSISHHVHLRANKKVTT